MNRFTINTFPLIKLFFIFLLFSCSKEKKESLFNSTGKINTISIVIDNKLWNGVVGDSIRNKFAAPVEGLPKEEPLFNINQYPLQLMEGFMTKSRSIIVIKKGDQNTFAIKKNQYAKPQNVFHITGNSVSAILEILEKKTPQIIQIIKKGEIAENQRLLNDSIYDPKVIQEQFQITLKIPTHYSYIIRNDNFIWLKKEFISGNNNLLIAQLPLHHSKNTFRLADITRIHDSIGTLYIQGIEVNSTMYIDKSYPIYFLKTMKNGQIIYETKGTWRLKNSFMLGPFVNNLIIDPKKNRIIFLQGFSYSPSKNKRDYMHELESIMDGIKIP